MLAEAGRQLIAVHDRLRFAKDRVFRPVVDALPGWLTPNQVTAFRTAATLVWLPYALLRPALWQVAIFACIYLLDLVDGAVARFRNRVTAFGSILDHVSDKFANVAVILAVYGATGYRFDLLVLFVWWDLAAAVAIAAEARWPALASIRAPLEFAVKTALWAFLLLVVLPALLSPYRNP